MGTAGAFPRTGRPRWSPLALVLLTVLLVLASCGTRTLPPPGQLMVVVWTDLNPGQDFDNFRLEVEHGNNTLYGVDFTVGAADREAYVQLPATLAVVAGRNTHEPVTIRLWARRGGTTGLVRVYKEVVTQIPEQGIVRVNVGIDWACLDWVEVRAANQVRSVCDEGYTCEAGSCQPVVKSLDSLSEYQSTDVFGGTEQRCFDVAACFASATRELAMVRAGDTCTAKLPTDVTRVTAALALPGSEHTGTCDDAQDRCLIPLDFGATGYILQGGSLVLPAAFCSDRSGQPVSRTVVLSSTCEPKTSANPPCGPWSSVKGGAEAGVTAPADAGLVLPRRGSTLAAGIGHTCTLDVDGNVSCAGNNGAGELGNGTRSPSSTPTKVTLASAAWSVCAGEHSCVLTSEGIRCWGEGAVGQRGTGGIEDVDRPGDLVPPPLGERWAVLACGRRATCAIGSEGTLGCWGDNTYAQVVGAPANSSILVPTYAAPRGWTWIAVGAQHSCGIQAPGSLWCWGRDENGELGIGRPASIRVDEPTQVGMENDWIDVQVGNGTTCGIRRGGSLWCWGKLESLGAAGTQLSPVQVANGTSFRRVRIGEGSVCAISEAGALWCVGANGSGLLGFGDQDARMRLTQVGTDLDWDDLSFGQSHFCARRTDGSTWCAGSNTSGQLGVGDLQSRSQLTRWLVP